MAKLYTIDSDNIEQSIIELPLNEFNIKRVFWIYNNTSEGVRGKHRHKKSTHMLHCVEGSCKVMINNGFYRSHYSLENKTQILRIDPSDWREMYDFSEDCILACFSNELYDSSDYIYKPYVPANILKSVDADFVLV